MEVNDGLLWGLMMSDWIWYNVSEGLGDIILRLIGLL